jgi:hypothetical protein
MMNAVAVLAPEDAGTKTPGSSYAPSRWCGLGLDGFRRRARPSRFAATTTWRLAPCNRVQPGSLNPGQQLDRGDYEATVRMIRAELAKREHADGPAGAIR